MTLSDLAEICHEANRTYCKTQGDHAHDPWHFADTMTKLVTIQGVKEYLQHPNMTRYDLHDRWRQWKEQQGWTYGPVKNEHKKQHPNLIEYAKLPVKERVKDSLFMAVIDTFRNMVKEKY